jgi:hypothetical protein
MSRQVPKASLLLLTVLALTGAAAGTAYDDLFAGSIAGGPTEAEPNVAREPALRRELMEGETEGLVAESGGGGAAAPGGPRRRRTGRTKPRRPPRVARVLAAVEATEVAREDGSKAAGAGGEHATEAAGADTAAAEGAADAAGAVNDTTEETGAAGSHAAGAEGEAAADADGPEGGGAKEGEADRSAGAKSDEDAPPVEYAEEGKPSALQRVTDLRVAKQARASEYYKMKRELKYLQKSVELKKGQSDMASSQVELDEDEISAATKQLQAIKDKDEQTVATYRELKSEAEEMQAKARKLMAQTDKMTTLTNVMSVRIQQLSVEEVLANSARGLPDSVAGALRRSAEALTPFMDTLMVAADTNQRLVDHVGAEIDKYTHVNIRKSPFLSGVLFYCVLLVPTLTIVSFARRVFDSSSNLTVSHFVIFGNAYFIAICLVAIVTTCSMHEDPAAVMHRSHAKVFATFNVLLALYYVWHVGMLGLQAAYTRERRNCSQALATVCVGVHYFLFTWRRIFTNSTPQMLVANYCTYLTIFACITVERVRRVNMTWARMRAAGARPGGDGSETTLGSYVSLVGSAVSGVGTLLGSAFASSAQAPTSKLRWDGAARRHSVLRSACSEEELDTNDEERGVDDVLSRRPQSARCQETTPSRGKRRQAPGEPEKKSFTAMFFGASDDTVRSGRSDEDDEAEEDGQVGWWHKFGRVAGYTAGSGGGARERQRTSPEGPGRSRRTAAQPCTQRQSYYSSWLSGTRRRDQ